jgi:DNA invertase Pin-like site-specific DNA recombinase
MMQQTTLTAKRAQRQSDRMSERGAETATGRVYSYTRFSTPGQAKGDSLRRQTKEAADWAAARGMTLDTELTFHDAGLSAWTGENEGGQLGVFREAVKTGLVPRGSVLAVESFDRLSRQGIRKTQRLVEDIIELGVTIVTTKDGKVYDAETLDDPLAAIMLILTAQRAREESDMKSRRVAAAWANKRANAATNVLTKNGPSWLTLSEDRKTWTVDERKADAVRRVYALATEGHGPTAIATRLNKEGATRLDNNSMGTATMWRPVTVEWLLGYSAVVGTLTLNARDVTARETVEGYFPAVVDVETYATVQAMRTGSKLARGRHAVDQTVRNVLAGLGRCPLCGHVMTRVTQGQRSAGGEYVYLVCDGARLKSGCSHKSVRLRDVETALVMHVEELTGHAEIAAGGPVLADLAEIETHISVTEDELGNLLDALAREPSPAIRERVREIEDTLDEMRTRAGELAADAAVSTGPMVMARLEKLRVALTTVPMDIAVANAAFRACARKVVVDYRTGHLVVHWVHGGTTEIMFAWPVAERAKRRRKTA